MSYSLVNEGIGFYLTFNDTVTNSDITESFEEITSHEHFRSMRYKILDFRYAKKFDISFRDMKILSYQDAALAKGGGFAAVAIVINESEGHVLGEEYKRHIAKVGWRCGIFKHIDTARGWLTAEGAHCTRSFAAG